MPRLLRAVAVLALLASSHGCAMLNQLFQKPTVNLRSVDLTSLSFTGIGASFVLDVGNPNPVGIDLARLAYQVTIEGKQLAAGQANQAVSVPASGAGTITLPVSIRFTDFVSSIEALLSRDQVNYSIAMQPGFNTPIGILDVPLSHSGQFPVPRVPQVSLGTPSLGGLDLTGATLSLPIVIHNKNGFPLPTTGLSYGLTVAGAAVLSATAAPGPLAANQQTSVPITARINFAQVGLGVMNALRGGGAAVALNGALDLGGYKLPLNLTTNLGR